MNQQENSLCARDGGDCVCLPLERHHIEHHRKVTRILVGNHQMIIYIYTLKTHKLVAHIHVDRIFLPKICLRSENAYVYICHMV